MPRTAALNILSCLLLASLAVNGCGGTNNLAPSGVNKSSPGPAAKVTLSPASATVAAGATQQFSAAVTDASGNAVTGVSLTWASSATAVATVSASGLVTGVAAGTANITATTGSITSAAAAVTVTPPPVAAVTIAPASPSIEVGATQAFTATAKDAKGNPITGATFTWSSSSTATATIDATGLATGKAAGTTNITAASGGITSAADVLTVQTPTQVTGTAATGSPLAGIKITLKDSANTSRTATTQSDGTFRLDTTGLTPPFMISATPASGSAALYSASDDANATTAINLDPLTDVTLRSWYSAQGLNIDTAFSNVSSTSVPTPAQLQPVLTFMQNQVQLWMNNNGVSPTNFNLITTPFTANGAGEDKVLDETTVTNTQTGATLAITDGTTTQATTLSYSTSSNSVTATTTTTSGSSSSTSTSTSIVPTNNTQSSALAAINAQCSALTQLFATKGSNLADTDIAPFLASNLDFEGLNQAQFAAEIATYARQGSASVTVTALDSLDAVNHKASGTIVFQLGQGQLIGEMNFDASSGAWLLAGDGRVAGVKINNLFFVQQASTPTLTQASSQLNADIKAAPGLVTAASVSGSNFGSGTAFTPQPQIQETFAPIPGGSLIVKLDHFDAGTSLTQLLPAGTAFTVNLTTTQGPATYTLYSHANTTEALQFTNLSSTSLSALTLGQNNTFSFTLPKTFPIASISLGSEAYNGDPSSASTTNCKVDAQVTNLSATSASVMVPATCNGAIQQVQITLDVTGLNGEETEVSTTFK